MVNRDKYRVDDEDDRDQGAARAPVKTARSTSRSTWFLQRLVVMAILLAVAVWFAPPIIASTSLWKTALAYAQPALAGKIEIERLSLGWLAPIELTGVVVRDAQGEPLAEAKSLRSEKTLFDLAKNPRSLGKFFLQEPHAKVVVRTDGSNLEDFLALLPIEEPEPTTPSQPVAFAVEVTRGAIDLDDRVAGKQWQINNLSATVDWPSLAGLARTGKLAAAIHSAGTNDAAGDFTGDFTWTPGSDAQTSFGSGATQGKFSSLPTGLAEVALRRLGYDIRPTGPLSAEIVYRWKENGDGQHLQVKQLMSPGLAVLAPDYLGSDEVSTAIATGQGDFEILGNQLIVRELKLQSDLVALAGSGSTQWTASSSTITPAMAAAGSELHVTGTVDLARLATQMPRTLQLRPDTRITSGRLEISFDGQSAAGQQEFRGTLRAEEFAGEASGRKIAWEQPISIKLAARQTPQGPVIDELLAEASFLNLLGQGTFAKGALSADANLDELARQLGQFADLGQNQLAGKLKANVDWQRGEQDRWQATADVRIQQLQLQMAAVPWSENDLQLHAEAVGIADATGLRRIDSASLLVASAADRLEAKLTGAIDSPSSSASFPLAYSLQGDLATWAPRLQAFVPLAGWRLGGGINLAGSGKFSTKQVDVAPTTLSIKQLVVAGPSIVIQEPVVEVRTSGRWDALTGTFSSPETTLRSSSLAFLADKLQIVSTAKETSLTGLLEFQGDLARLSAAVSQPQQEKTWQLAGMMTGRMEMRYEGSAVQAAFTTDIENLAYLTRPASDAARGQVAITPAASSSPWQTQWVEPRVSLEGQGKFDSAADLMQLAKGSFTSSALSFAVAGSVKELSQRGLADLQGDIAYDMAGITEKLRPLLGETLAITGRESRKFALHGPLFTSATTVASAAPAATVAPAGLVPAELVGEASVGWESARYVGLQAGPTMVNAKLDRGTVFLGPLDVPLSEGRLLAAPRLLLNQAEPLVVMDKGPAIDHVRISPELCHAWLKYVAPLLADVTRAEGKFSVALDGAAVPLFDPARGNVAGMLNIHAAQVGPGPLAQEYIALANQLKTVIKADPQASQAIDPARGWIVLPEQAVQFHVLDGRVHHRGMTMLVGDVQIVTQGSVGLDQTISLTAAIPVQESWTKGNSLLAGLKGQTIEIPISGNLSQPKLDSRVLEEFSRRVVGNAAQNLIEKNIKSELNKGLERLFGPAKP
jgi:hypothetical protein